DSMGLGFSSWSLEALTLEWQLDQDMLEIRNGLVTGPVLEVALGGLINLETRMVDMEANLTLMRGMFGLVVSPVSETLQFDMRGPFENPTWSIRFKPFRWFQNRMVPKENSAEL
ncbi:MAG TPA: hypothetical protein VK995_02160, partial [Oceanipulchritudo sp.]|nr:hypothetical protein [Oceanipulchritudo sp.]